MQCSIILWFLQLMILGRLPVCCILNVSSTCRELRSLANDSSLWQHLVFRDFGKYYFLLSPSEFMELHSWTDLLQANFFPEHLPFVIVTRYLGLLYVLTHLGSWSSHLQQTCWFVSKLCWQEAKFTHNIEVPSSNYSATTGVMGHGP